MQHKGAELICLIYPEPQWKDLIIVQVPEAQLYLEINKTKVVSLAVFLL